MFHAQDCKIMKGSTRKIIVEADRTTNNLYILNGIKGERCYIGQIDERWLLHRRMGHMKIW